ncbi:MAG: HD domain-containing protein [Clostridiales bacterium]|jgi:uncharacterized protein|nr:HD domain-containing protein [Clostridiales bacterium]
MKNRRLSEQLLNMIKKEAKLYFQNARGSHDWDHTERVLKLCLRIGRKEKADLEVLRLAAMLHDIGREEEDRSNGRVCHGEKGAALAKAILKKHGVEKEMVGRIIHCIETHRFRQKRPPQTLEAKILFDADKLDSIGAVGIGRAFLFAGEVGARLHNPGINLKKTKAYTKDDTAYREFLVKLRKIEGRLFTRDGRRIARDRHRFMAEFFDRLNKEIEGSL